MRGEARRWTARSRLRRRLGRIAPAERADQPFVLLAEPLGLRLGHGERAHDLVPFRAGDQVIVPDHAEVSFAPAHADLVAEAAGWVAVDLALAEEVDEPRSQGAADVAAELLEVLVPPLAGVWGHRQVALGNHLPSVESLEHAQALVVPVRVPVAVGPQVVLAVGCDQKELLECWVGISRQTRERAVAQLGGGLRCASGDRQRALDVEPRLDGPRPAGLGTN